MHPNPCILIHASPYNHAIQPKGTHDSSFSAILQARLIRSVKQPIFKSSLERRPTVTSSVKYPSMSNPWTFMAMLEYLPGITALEIRSIFNRFSWKADMPDMHYFVKLSAKCTSHYRGQPSADLGLGLTWANQPLLGVSANWALKQRDTVTVFIKQCYICLQIRFSGREFKIPPGWRNLVLSE